MDQIAEADTIFLFGSNPTECHPIVGLHLKKGLRRGAKLIVADPRRIDLVDRADIWLGLKPGSNLALINGMLNVILTNGWENKEYIATRTEGFVEVKANALLYPPERVEKLTGVAKETIIAAAKLYAKSDKSMIVYGLGVTEHITGTENAMAMGTLALVCGHLGRRGAGVMSLRGQNNVQGATDMAAVPHMLPGYQLVSEPEVRAKFEKKWQAPISPRPGLESLEMYDAARAGKFKGMFLMGVDPAQTDPDLHAVRKSLNALDFLVVLDMFHTETTAFADVILPGASFAEKDGTFTNLERRIQRVNKAIEPIAGKAEWQIICEIATRMGYPMHYNHPAEIMNEIASLAPNWAGIDYQRLGTQGLQWPCPSKDHPGTATRYEDDFPRYNKLGRMIALDHVGSGEIPDHQYPLILTTGRRREHHNNASMTMRTEGIAKLVPEELLEISSGDATRLGIDDGDYVRVVSRRGQIKVKSWVTTRAQDGIVFLAFHHREALTNDLTSGFRDPITSTPEYKSCAVRVEKS